MFCKYSQLQVNYFDIYVRKRRRHHKKTTFFPMYTIFWSYRKGKCNLFVLLLLWLFLFWILAKLSAKKKATHLPWLQARLFLQFIFITSSVKSVNEWIEQRNKILLMDIEAKYVMLCIFFAMKLISNNTIIPNFNLIQSE